MDIRRLESFCRVYENKSFSKAANDLFLSQPTVSSHVLSLEEELGCRLFDRIGRSILPTQAGTVLFEHASRIIEQVDQALTDINLLQNRVVGRLSLGGSTIPSHYLLPRVLKGFADRYPEVDIVLHTADSSGIEERLLEGRLDLGVIGASEAFPELEYTQILRDELRVLGSPELAMQASPADVSTLCRLPWILREKGSGTRKAMEAALERFGLSLADLRIALTVHTTEAVMQGIKAGIGLSITSRLVAADAMERGEVVAIESPGLDLARAFYAVRHRQREQYPAVRLFLESLLAMSEAEVFGRAGAQAAGPGPAA